MFFALSSLPSWFGLPLFVKTRAIATLEGTGEKREFLILRFSHILHFAPYNGGFMYEIQKTLHFWDCTPSYGWMHPHRNPKRMEQEKAKHLVTTWRSGCTLMVKLQLQAQVGLADSGLILYMEFVEGNIVGQQRVWSRCSTMW